MALLRIWDTKVMQLTSVLSESSVVKIAPAARIWELGYAAASRLGYGEERRRRVGALKVAA